LAIVKSIVLALDDSLLRKAHQYADEHDTTLETLLAEHVALLADRAGRQLTVREQTYVDNRPPDEVVQRLRTENERKRS
jgi:hypothetical protein